MSRAPTLLDLLARDPQTCKVSMVANPWVLSWSGGVIGCHNMRHVREGE
jgi:hypothetical protein